MAETPGGSKEIPEGDRKRAQLFFDRARTIAETGNYEYAIELYQQGLASDPDSVDTHQSIRELSMIRKARGGKPLGMFAKPKATKDDKQAMLNAEKLLAYDPSSMEYMQQMMLAAQRAGCYDTVVWVGGLLLNANFSSKQPSFQRYILLKDTFKAIGKFREALDVMTYAQRMKPTDMDLNHEAKNLAASMTIDKGGYDQGDGSFKQSIRDKDAQKRLQEKDTDIRTDENLLKGVQEAEVAYNQDPADIARFGRYVEALRRTEMPEYESRAMALLEARFKETRQYKFQAQANLITVSQLGRRERILREAVAKAPADMQARKTYQEFVRDKTEQELRIYKETVSNYPTDTTARYEMSRRLFMLKRWDEAIPALQQVRMDPKYRIQSTIFLGRAFLEAGFVDEAVDTLQEAVQSYQVRGDEKSIDIHYWCAISLEAKGDKQAALKMYSQVAQWNFNYRDVQQRIKRLRGAA